MKFTDAGRVTISAYQADDELHIAVADTGIGIAAAELPFIFEEFRQVDDGSSRRFDGTGLGLAIAKRYADLLGGRIDVTSTPGEGSVFTLVLPRTQTVAASASHAPITPPVQTPPLSDAGVSRAHRILLVEDSEPAIVQITDILAEVGYEVQVVRNGREALEAIGEQVPNAMILDLMMPEVDGFQVLQAIRSVESTVQLPVLILTAKHVTREELSVLKGNHIRQLIQKGGISRAELLVAVEKMVAPPDQGEGSAGLGQGQRARQQKAVILCVDDNPDNMQTVRALLSADYKLIEATDADEAVAQAERFDPGLILLDVALPTMDGFKTFDTLRALDSTKHIPIVALTARAMQGDREEILSRGFDGYLSKPVDPRHTDQHDPGVLVWALDL